MLALEARLECGSVRLTLTLQSTIQIYKALKVCDVRKCMG